MALAVKTVEFPFETRLTNLATGTTLAASAEHTFTAITVGLPESSKTIRSAHLEITHQLSATTTARRLDGVRIGVQIDAVAFNDGTDLTGTGIAQTADPYAHFSSRDVTAYFVTNYTGTSHTVGVRVRFEHDIADNVNNITCKLIVTYEYEDTSATQTKTVRIPLEGETSFLSTTDNADIRGTAGAAQIPALDTWLPEDSKVYRHIWFEVYATSGGAATTDFNVNYSIDSGATAVRATLEQGLNGSSRFYDIWIQNGLVTSTAHDFEAWSSLASRFQNFYVIMYVTYEFAESSSTIMNSVMLSIPSDSGIIGGTTAADRDVYDRTFWIEEPGPITMRQSAAVVHFGRSNASNLSLLFEAQEAGAGAHTTARLYTGTNLTHSGSYSVCQRLDLAHGGTALSLGRGRNKILIKAFVSSGTNIAQNLCGYYIINYTSGKSSKGIGAHNTTTKWMIADFYSTVIAGTAVREIATANQRTPNIPQANYFLNGTMFECMHNMTGGANFFALFAEVLSGEGDNDGWAMIDNVTPTGSGEFGWFTSYFSGRENWKRYPNAPSSGYNLDIETARKYRLYGNFTMQASLVRVLTTHSITFTVDGNVTGSNGGTVEIGVFDKDRGVKVGSTSRSGNGSYSVTVYDNVNDHYSEAQESDSYLGRSANDKPNGTP